MNFFDEIDEYFTQIIEDSLLNSVMQQSVDSYHNDLFKKNEMLKINLSPSVFSKKNSETCFICYCPFQENEIVYDLSCNHTFHKECLDKAVLFQHTKCAICRKDIPIHENNLTNSRKETNQNGHMIHYNL